MTIQSFRELIVWQKSMELVKEIYSVTSQLPHSEQFSLSSQMQRAAISIPSNIAEGSCRQSRKDYARFLWMSYGSSAELDTQMSILETQYPRIGTVVSRELLAEVQKMLNAMIRRMNEVPVSSPL